MDFTNRPSANREKKKKKKKKERKKKEKKKERKISEREYELKLHQRGVIIRKIGHSLQLVLLITRYPQRQALKVSETRFK